MSKNFSKKPLAVALGAAFMVAGGTAHASANPFVANELSSGYQLVGEGKCGEGKCGGAKKAEGKCGEGKCGGAKKAEGKCGEGKCGEGKCGGSK